MTQFKIDAFEKAAEKDLFNVGEVREENFLNDIHAAVDTGEGAPPKTEPAETSAPEQAETSAPDPGYSEPTPGASQAEPFLQGGQQQIQMDKILSGEIAFTLVDKFLPMALVYVLKTQGIKAKSTELQASAKERPIVVQVIDRALAEVNINFDNPFVALGVVLFSVYGSKGLEMYMTREKEPEPAKNPYNKAAGLNANGTVKKDGRGRPRKS